MLSGAADARDAAKAPLSCLVVAVRDGDTLTAQCPQGRLQVRLREIDAPERTQPYARRATDALKSMCLGRQAQLRETGLDRYGRTLARVTCGRADASEQQVRRGFAWAFTRYLTDPRIAALEVEARERGLGLWQQANPVAPWVFRHGGT